MYNCGKKGKKKKTKKYSQKNNNNNGKCIQSRNVNIFIYSSGYLAEIKSQMQIANVIKAKRYTFIKINIEYLSKFNFHSGNVIVRYEFRTNIELYSYLDCLSISISISVSKDCVYKVMPTSIRFNQYSSFCLCLLSLDD